MMQAAAWKGNVLGMMGLDSSCGCSRSFCRPALLHAELLEAGTPRGLAASSLGIEPHILSKLRYVPPPILFYSSPCRTRSGPQRKAPDRAFSDAFSLVGAFLLVPLFAPKSIN